MSNALATLVVRLRWLVVVAWLVAAAAATVFLPSLQDAESLPLSRLVPEDAEAVATAERAARAFEYPVLARTAVVQRDPDGLSTEAQARLAERALEFRRGGSSSDGPIAFALPVANTLGLLPGSEESSTTAVTFLFFDPATPIGEETAAAHRFVDARYEEDDAVVGVTGAAPARLAEWDAIASALPWVTLATVAAILVVLALNYRALLAPLVTLLAAGVAYLVSVRVAAWAGERTGLEIPSDVEPVMIVLLLGIVTDYAVFFLSGMRKHLLAGERPTEAAIRSTAENLAIVVTAGLIVSVGVAALLVGRLEFFRSFGPGAALAVLVSLLVSVTLIPALLGIFGRALFWPALPDVSRVRPRRRLETWRESLAVFVASRPVAALVAALALVLVALASRGLLEADLGFTSIKGLPSISEERRAAEAAQEGFADGVLSPTELLVEQEGGSLREEALARLESGLEQQKGVAAVVGPGNPVFREIPGLVISETVPAVRYLVILEDEPHGSEAIASFERLRSALPSLLAGAGLEGVHAGLTGETAIAAETVRTLQGDVARIALAALLVNFVLLVVFLRALVAPLFLLAASVMALTATLGLTTLVFQNLLGHGELTYFVPFVVAVLLLSLGSDYNVFLVGHVRQEWERLSVQDAVARAAPRASRAIAIAGVALALSFATLAIVPLRQFREFAFAMAVGVLLDAFVIRSFLVPALVSLFGDLSWWPRRRTRVAVRGPAR